jgi:hypothetical protein
VLKSGGRFYATTFLAMTSNDKHGANKMFKAAMHSFTVQQLEQYMQEAG